jgi:hypothetical protein
MEDELWLIANVSEPYLAEMTDQEILEQWQRLQQAKAGMPQEVQETFRDVLGR